MVKFPSLVNSSLLKEREDVISINIHATFYGGMKLPAKYVPNSETHRSVLSGTCVYCPAKNDVITTKGNLVYQQTHKTSKDRVHIIDLFQLIPFFSFWQERHRQEQQINNIFKEKFKQIIECTHHHHQIFSDITAKIFNSSYQSSHYDIHVWNFSCGHSVWKGSRNIAISSESIKTLDIISDKFFHSCNIFNTVNWYF